MNGPDLLSTVIFVENVYKNRKQYFESVSRMEPHFDSYGTEILEFWKYLPKR